MKLFEQNSATITPGPAKLPQRQSREVGRSRELGRSREAAQTLTRRAVIASSAAAAISCTAMSCSAPAKPPNILLVLSDDHSYPHAGVYGDRFVRTPNFDRVAKEGLLFTNSFACSPSCTPSRSSLLSGRHIWQCGEAGVL